MFEHWTMLIVFLFLLLILSIWVTIKPNNLRKRYSEISEVWSNLHLYKSSPIISPIWLSICLSVLLSVMHEDILRYILKSDKARFWKIVFSLSRWLGKREKFGPKAEYLAFYRVQRYFLCFKWYPIIIYTILWKLYIREKSGFQVIGQNALHLSDYRININISKKLF